MYSGCCLLEKPIISKKSAIIPVILWDANNFGEKKDSFPAKINEKLFLKEQNPGNVK